MELAFGKSISGGTPLTREELEAEAKHRLQKLRESFTKKQVAKSEDVISQRLAEELRLVQRMLEMVEHEMRAKGQKRAADEIHRGEEAIEDIAEVIEADDRCEAIGEVDEDLARRLTRRAMDGSGTPCDNRRASVFRKAG